MSTGVRVSAVLATYDGAPFLEAQLESIMRQSRPVDEIVLSDDGSRDGTVEVARRVLDRVRHPMEVRLLEDNPVPGVARNFEHAVQAASGEVILLSDQDDIWGLDRVERTLDHLVRRPELVVVHADACLVDADGAWEGTTLFSALGVSAEDLARIDGGEAIVPYLRRNLATGATMAVRRDWALGAMPVPEYWLHDEWFAVLAALERRLGVIAEPIIDYRQHGGNQIGVRVPTLRHRWSRLIEPRGQRLEILARRAEVLRDRVSDRPVDTESRRRLQAKVDFELTRARYPSRRPLRVFPILRAARGYPDFASQGRLDMLRDLIQPA